MRNGPGSVSSSAPSSSKIELSRSIRSSSGNSFNRLITNENAIPRSASPRSDSSPRPIAGSLTADILVRATANHSRSGPRGLPLAIASVARKTAPETRLRRIGAAWVARVCASRRRRLLSRPDQAGAGAKALEGLLKRQDIEVPCEVFHLLPEQAAPTHASTAGTAARARCRGTSGMASCPRCRGA